MRRALITAGLIGTVLSGAAAQEMRPPRISSAQVDWPAALASLADTTELRAARVRYLRPARSGANAAVPRALARINAAMAHRFPGVAQSPVPVLLPFDTAALMRDLEAGRAPEGNERYLGGFKATKFFYTGPSGYDAVFSLRTNEVAEFDDIKFPDPIDVLISGSALLYELDDPTPPEGTPVAALEADYPGIRRTIHEHHVRYTFIRFGAPYMVSTTCFNSSVSRYRMPTCRSADRVLVRFLRSLRVAGGTPKPPRVVQQLAAERPTVASPTFTYHRPGRLLPDTGFRGNGGTADFTVYSQIRFPLADPPAYVNSQMFQSRNKAVQPGQDVSPNYSYPWRDNFCERRGFPVGQCLGGVGHQGQDIRTPLCPHGPEGERCSKRRDLVAVRDGAIMRRAKQGAVYLFVNTGTEHIRFRYLHMVPSKMDEDNLLSGRHVREGEVIAQVGNFNNKVGGTSYHLHFDIQVPTRDGWVFVNPFMTLVASYERLIRGRGTQMSEPVAAVSTDPATTGSAEASTKIMEPEKAKPSKRAESASKKRKAAKQTKQKSKAAKHAKQKRKAAKQATQNRDKTRLARQ